MGQSTQRQNGLQFLTRLLMAGQSDLTRFWRATGGPDQNGLGWLVFPPLFLCVEISRTIYF